MAQLEAQNFTLRGIVNELTKSHDIFKQNINDMNTKILVKAVKNEAGIKHLKEAVTQKQELRELGEET